jgi:hypothetical protein
MTEALSTHDDRQVVACHQTSILKSMATITRTMLIDDIDGSEAVETLQFNADGTKYEIDLSAANADRLRAQLARFVAAATPIKPPKTSPGKRSAKSPARSNKAELQAIREWAQKAGYQVSNRGRIAKTIQDAYNAAN